MDFTKYLNQQIPRFYGGSNGNWGFLVDEQEKIRLAPIYNCGSCLYPQLDDETIKDFLKKPKEFYKIMIQKRYEDIIQYSYEKLTK